MNNVVKYSLLFAASVAAIHLVKNGPWRTWKQGRFEGKAVDPWTLQHVMWGMIANRMGLTVEQHAVLGAINEVGELWIRRNRPGSLWGTPESPVNVAVDLLANTAGWYLADRIRA